MYRTKPAGCGRSQLRKWPLALYVDAPMAYSKTNKENQPTNPMTYFTIFGFEYEGDVAETICLHDTLSKARGRGAAWREEEHTGYDYMKIMEPADILGDGCHEIERFERG